MDIVAMLFAWVGAFLTAQKTNKHRMIGFVCYLVANLLWIVWSIVQQDIMLTVAGQAIGFLIPSTIGLINNRKG